MGQNVPLWSFAHIVCSPYINSYNEYVTSQLTYVLPLKFNNTAN